MGFHDEVYGHEKVVGEEDPFESGSSRLHSQLHFSESDNYILHGCKKTIKVKVVDDGDAVAQQLTGFNNKRKTLWMGWKTNDKLTVLHEHTYTRKTLHLY